MKLKFSSIVIFLSVCFVVLVATIQPGRPELSRTENLLPPALSAPTAPNSAGLGIPLGCAIQPERNPVKPPVSPARPVQVLLSRFRQINPATPIAAGPRPINRPAYTPREEVALADLTNFGDRYIKDLNGRLTDHAPIIVLHETVGSARSAINYFQTPHPRDEDQVSYHTLIGLDGTIYYLVPPDKRAFGAGNSVFIGANGAESVQTNPDFPPSVNNFAYHISLETPADGDNNNSSHSGYTNAQYQSLAWLVAKTGVPNDRITFHKTVDRSGSRQDPRSFNAQAFLALLDTYPRTNEIVIGCSIALSTP
ncbi:MAG: N-acetylmuramoyl-L-alanine amidase [Elainella sp. C42_A2020_010]|nr:N-acetylmuramoyl-L-alanine amidase [Elainella sp. C42_A2020_010]